MLELLPPSLNGMLANQRLPSWAACYYIAIKIHRLPFTCSMGLYMNKLEHILDTGHGLRRQSPPQSGDYAGLKCCLGEDHSVHSHSQRSSHYKEVQACEQPGRCNHTKSQRKQISFLHAQLHSLHKAEKCHTDKQALQRPV